MSIIFAARDEARGIEAAVRSHLAQQYASLEVIAIDDRSVDGTGAILDAVASADPRLRVIHVEELPDGWLGKNHALHAGAAVATGEILLFTDADVVFTPDAVGRAAGLMASRGLDHLTAGPAVTLPTAPLALVVHFFTMWFLLFFRPWAASTPGSRWHMGIGAFNMVRTARYRAIGGHTAIALRPDDDVRLGRLIKREGGRQLVARGDGAITVEWYASLPELVRGLRKNTFAALDYSLPMVAGAVIGQLAINVWPFIALAITSGLAFWLNLGTVAILMSIYAGIAGAAGNRPWLALAYPIAAIVFAHIIVASTWRTLRRGGIEWRGTFYPIDALRRNRA